jgi:endonuclease/exonuclease/phosphatase family metal-dependent hydrolase
MHGTAQEFAPDVASPADLPSSGETLRVTTFNLLAPVWTHQSVYPSMDMVKFDPPTRRKAQRARILDLDSDIICMQECQKSELDLLLSEDEGILEAKYDVEFCPFPLTFWANWLTDATNYEPRENGVCVLTKKTVVCKTRVEHVPIDLPEWETQLPTSSLGAHACFVHATGPSWLKSRILIVVSHLDADSVLRAGLQGLALAQKIKDVVDSTIDLDTVIWGGDFNMEHRGSAMRAIQAEGFKIASSVSKPTVYAVPCTVRVDHILYYHKGPKSIVQPIATLVPACPLGHKITIMPFMSELQWLRAVGANCEKGYFAAASCAAVAILLLPLTLLLLTPAFIYACEREEQCKRLEWALSEWGSDHLPVTVCFQSSNQLELEP